MINVLMSVSDKGVPQPVDFIRKLIPYVGGLRNSHSIMNQIAEGKTVVVTLDVDKNLTIDTINLLESYGVKIELLYGEIL